MSTTHWQASMLDAIRNWNAGRVNATQLADDLVASLIQMRHVPDRTRAELELWVLAVTVAEDVASDPGIRPELELALKERQSIGLLGAGDVSLPPQDAAWLPFVVGRIASIAERTGLGAVGSAAGAQRVLRYRGLTPGLSATEVVRLAREFCSEFGMLNRRRWPPEHGVGLSTSFGVEPLESFLTAIWPGTVTIGALERWNWFAVTSTSLAALARSLRTVCEFSDGVPAEDLCLWHRDGRPLLESVSHEGTWWLCLDESEVAVVRRDFPEVWSRVAG